jgi:hypothetical protein
MWTFLLTVLMLSLVFLPIGNAQTAAPKSVDDVSIDKWNSTLVRGRVYAGLQSEPAPRRDLSGVWDAAGDAVNGPAPGVQATGAHEHPAVLPGNNSPPGGEPDERKIPKPLPYTPLGEETLKAHKPTSMGVRSVPAVLGNDPVNLCDPPGFPRLNLDEFRTIEILQAPDHITVLYQFFRTWRTIWIDGRELPADPEPRWNGYSVGRWVDDYTLAVETVGMIDKTWLDKAGRPHSAELKVEERFQRVSRNRMELTVTIRDPQMYTEPWLAMNKFPLRLQPRGFDIREMYCSPSDIAEYNEEIGDPIATPSDEP